ncbi:hypothetical protein FLA105534_03176 [Flavobacterium bizetiae]|uniref:TonB C-terminal domain-containing protein n=1 Tax=Flavobacterium bizetiae TaxID=2704140 RepID=A0A6J4GR87_9FLAO|nr:energy transducer TonB [Flavobacterium bizetiae]CAA9200665.1 hypothetical protein FLA105534_03176 [Flavobacterium bizetiae]CAD5342370.1 hypothetical protein FLA105535_02356 [Flavobacterium bizetiae]CAD5348891.1 hypothetical protein FLA105534_02862 [Flavobacterium bizetiae]
MKKFLILILICSVQNIFSQAKTNNKVSSIDEDERQYKTLADFPPVPIYPEDENQVYNTAGMEVKPVFPGGLDQLYKFISENYKKPKENPELKGKVFVTFIIEKNGSLTDIKILRDLGFGTGAEAIRVLNFSPKWIPGKQNNKEVRTLYSLPITIN